MRYPWLLLGVVGIAGYLYYKNKNSTASQTTALNNAVNALATQYPAANTSTSATPTVNADGSSNLGTAPAATPAASS